MAQRTHIDLIDDLDGSPAAETVSFSVDGVGYEIDLSEGNAARLRNALAPFVAAGRKQSNVRRQGRRKSGSVGDATAIRTWAQAQGLAVSNRGRVSAEIRQAYENAHR